MFRWYREILSAEDRIICMSGGLEDEGKGLIGGKLMGDALGPCTGSRNRRIIDLVIGKLGSSSCILNSSTLLLLGYGILSRRHLALINNYLDHVILGSA